MQSAIRNWQSAILAVCLSAVPSFAAVTTSIVAFAAADGSALGGPVVMNSADGSVSYPAGFTKYSNRGTALFANQMPPALGQATYFFAYDGRLAVFYNATTSQTLAYTVGPHGFALIGSLTHPLCHGDPPVLLTGSEIVMLLDDTGRKPPLATIVAFDRRLNRTRWHITDITLSFDWLGDDVVACKFPASIDFYRRGRLLAQHPVSDPGTSSSCGKNGAVVYWTTASGSNSPVTYATARGVVVSNVPLSEAGTVWSSCRVLNRTMFYAVATPGPQTNIMYAYRLGRTIELAGSRTVNFLFHKMGVDGTCVYVDIHTPFGNGIAVYSSDLQAVRWGSQLAPGEIHLLDNGVYCRTYEMAASTSLEVFNRNGVIATHVFTKP